MPPSSLGPIDDADLVATLPGFTNAYAEVNGISYDFLAAFLGTAAPDATVLKLPNTGHWIPDEQPEETVRHLNKFFG
ncbi:MULTISPECIES: alpha/beta fold hydrolase [Paraburkholderia]|uniref:Alpha/beta hydrolase n=1 Tax=Paraburkholderia madseniana TaxID=2599607 RepID=A0AAP5BF32_9BURK|nr:MULTISPECIES: hypothetical protein [Paraburkholderia]MCX4148325.1 hypothetical protein [Paraburkholderia madseniana]MDN7151263.1 hypothetical protein [Paraburkholderia sp. WS6]MDQ6410143.1 hypothetical protein [Paraburkholderia madseniana]